MTSNIEMENIQIDRGDENQEQQNRPRFERMQSKKVMKLRKIFDSLDLDRNGYVSMNELKKIVEKHPRKLPRNLVKEIMKQGDTNSDGVLSFEEFCKISDDYKAMIERVMRRYCEIVSYSDSMSVWPAPLTILSFSFIQLITFLIDIIFKVIHEKSVHENTVINNTTGTHSHTLDMYLVWNPYRRNELWRFVTYMFVHSDWGHLVFNLIFQIFLGFVLELVHSWWRVTLVYLAGILAASMANSIIEPDTCLNGASGGVYAIFTAHIATIIMNWQEMEYRAVQTFVFSIYFVTEITYTTYHHFWMQDEIGSGYTAHMSGALAGLLVGIVALKNLKELPWERRLWFYAVGLYLLLIASGIIIHIFFAQQFKIPPLNKNAICGT